MEEKLKEIQERFNTAVAFKEVEARFVKTTNFLFNRMEGQISPHFKLENMIAHFGTFHTSYIIQVYLEGNIMTITTRNSTYVFEILDAELLEWWNDGVLFELGYKEIRLIEEYLNEEFRKGVGL